MNLQTLNELPKTQLEALLTKCCGSSRWVEEICGKFPFSGEAELFKEAGSIWYRCSETDWLEAFTHHPKIGDTPSLKQKFATTADWAAGEQASVKQTSQEILESLSEANRLYEERFGYIFIVCATGKSAEQMLELLMARLNNHPKDEIKIAMEEQNKITAIRLKKLLQP